MKEWKEVMNGEIAKNQKKMELVNLLEGKEMIVIKWIYKIKFNEDGSIQKHKSRLVAKGSLQ